MIRSRQTFDTLMRGLPNRQPTSRTIDGDSRVFYRDDNALHAVSAGGDGWVLISRNNLPPTPPPQPAGLMLPPPPRAPQPAHRAVQLQQAAPLMHTGMGLLLEQPVQLHTPLAATAEIMAARNAVAYDIRVSSCPIGAGPRLGSWLLQRDFLYMDARRLFNMSAGQLETAVSTGFAPNQAGREAIARVTGIHLVPVAELDLARDLAASNPNRAAARELGEWLQANGLHNYTAAEAELAIPQALISRAVRTGYASPAVRDRIYDTTGIFLDD